MTEPAVPLSAEEIDHLRAIRVCGCDGDCAMSSRCPSPVLDGIGADWIASHFDQIIATLAAKDAEIAELLTENAALEAKLTGVLSMSMCTKCGLHAVPTAYPTGGGSAPLKLTYRCPSDGCGYLVSPPMSAKIEALEADIAEGERKYWELHAALTARAGSLEPKLREAEDAIEEMRKLAYAARAAANTAIFHIEEYAIARRQPRRENHRPNDPLGHWAAHHDSGCRDCDEREGK